MIGVPTRTGGRANRDSQGKIGIIYDEAPESEAFSRWHVQSYATRVRNVRFASVYRPQRTAYHFLKADISRNHVGSRLRIAGLRHARAGIQRWGSLCEQLSKPFAVNCATDLVRRLEGGHILARDEGIDHGLFHRLDGSEVEGVERILIDFLAH